MITPILSYFEVALTINGSATAKVDDKWIELLVNHNVVRFNVAMKYTFRTKKT